MPIYDYLCTECDHRADILHGINDPGPHFCPSCGKEGTMRKQFAVPSIHFKGSGWAKKDRGASTGTRASRATSDTAGDHADATGESKGEPKGESKGESKGDAKAESKAESKGEPKGETSSSSSGSSSAASSAPSTD